MRNTEALSLRTANAQSGSKSAGWQGHRLWLTNIYWGLTGTSLTLCSQDFWTNHHHWQAILSLQAWSKIMLFEVSVWSDGMFEEETIENGSETFDSVWYLSRMPKYIWMMVYQGKVILADKQLTTFAHPLLHHVWGVRDGVRQSPSDWPICQLLAYPPSPLCQQ